ncbi:MAG: hypothetical protein M9924_05995 [Rhizobiaceae bacterium]|nr:hypothetical protein [Rhizobiaceae bacterium]
MRANTNGVLLVLLSLGLVGCSTSGGGGVSGAPATGTVVAQSDMPEFCQNAAVSKYGVSADSISTNSPMTRSFGTLVQGSVYKDTVTVGFDCRFDTKGAFLGVIEQ